MRSLVEELREMAVRHAINTPKTVENWPVWMDTMNTLGGNFDNVDFVLDIGSNLKQIFRSTRPDEQRRGQGAVSSGGRAWEGLVCWYLNLCMIGTRCVAMKYNKSMVPDCISDAITVRHGTNAVTSESDLVVLVFPSLPQYTELMEDRYDKPLNIKNRKKILKYMNDRVRDDFASMELGIIQCKTNWNDSAQIPMLWNMIYDAGEFNDQQIRVGINNFSIRQLNRFTYSFVTVPSQNDIDARSRNRLHVIRVRTLSGLNYWGQETVIGVADSLREIFARNFGAGIDDGIRASLGRHLPHIHDEYGYLLNPVP